MSPGIDFPHSTFSLWPHVPTLNSLHIREHPTHSLVRRQSPSLSITFPNILAVGNSRSLQFHKLKGHMLDLNSAKGGKKKLELQRMHLGKGDTVTYSFQEQQGKLSMIQRPSLRHQWCDQRAHESCVEPGVDRTVGSVSSMMSQAWFFGLSQNQVSPNITYKNICV